MATRRTFLKGVGAVAIAGTTGLISSGDAKAAQAGRGGAKAGARGLMLCNLRNGNGYGLGVKLGNGILDVAKAGKLMRKKVPATTDEVIQGIDIDGLQAVIAAARGGAGAKGLLLDERAIQFGPCVTNPEKIIMLGFNYRKHAIETHTPIPTSPVLFGKYNVALSGHNGTIRLPVKVAKKFDYEVELQVVIGRVAREVSENEALDYVFGYSTGNDFSARDLQSKTSQFLLGKTCDGFQPLGPYLVSADLVGDPQKLRLETRVNGEQRQDSNTSDMIFSCAQIISYASQHFTLKPGDVISTGTPEGVINGKPPEKQVWLKPGDKIACSVEKCGELRFDLSGPASA
ncbi:MAG TPA: fumarylacetoacetate hydrolase family protein [Myxococcales bacterium]